MHCTMKYVKSYILLCTILMLGIILLMRCPVGPFSTAFLESNLRHSLLVLSGNNNTSSISMSNTSFLTSIGDTIGEIKTTGGYHFSGAEVTKRPRILILTYMRSGSTLTSGILKQSGNIFFSMEPLWGIYRRCYRRKSDVCCRNDICRSPNGDQEGLHVAIQTMKDIFNCKFDTLRMEVLSSFRFFFESSGNKELRRNKCFTSINNTTQTDWCLKYLTSVCETSSGVIVKTLRLSGELLSFLKEMIPDLKIVHLFRDPRGVLNSRKIIKDFFDKNTDISDYARQLCNRMSYDIESLKSLGMHYVPVRYECLSDNTNVTVGKLYAALNITITNSVKDWLDTHMKAKNNSSGGFGFQSKNSSVVAHSWRYSMDFRSVTAVDSMCARFYEETGIFKISTVSDLINTEFSTYSGDVYSHDTC